MSLLYVIYIKNSMSMRGIIWLGEKLFLCSLMIEELWFGEDLAFNRDARVDVERVGVGGLNAGFYFVISGGGDHGAVVTGQ